MAVHRVMVAGIDGCKAGWIAVAMPVGHPEAARMHVLAGFAGLLAWPALPDLVAVDMPVGLPQRVGAGGRGAEQAVRPFIGARRSSVFAIPSRAAVYSADYASARLAALATSDPPRSISKQAYNIFPKIRELDGLLRANARLAARVFECHPEASFRAMAGAPLLFAKKHASGIAERLALLRSAGFATALLLAKPPPGAGQDDLLDACAVAWTAQRIATGKAICFPPATERDSLGLAMNIWA